MTLFWLPLVTVMMATHPCPAIDRDGPSGDRKSIGESPQDRAEASQRPATVDVNSDLQTEDHTMIDSEPGQTISVVQGVRADAASQDSAASESTPPDARAWIHRHTENDLYVFKAMARVAGNDGGRYQLVVERDGSSGRTRNTQKGNLPAEATVDGIVTLTRVAIRVGEGDDWTASLTVTFGDGDEIFEKIDHRTTD